jgi:hypothetical protein
MNLSKIRVATALGALIICSLINPASAKNEWQARNEQRVHEGIHNGTINPYEARDIKRRHYRINKYAVKAHHSGGHIGLGERMKIQSMKAGTRVKIFHDKHDKY